MGKGGGKQRGKKRPEQGFFVLDDADYEEDESFMVRDSAPAGPAADAGLTRQRESIVLTKGGAVFPDRPAGAPWPQPTFQLDLRPSGAPKTLRGTGRAAGQTTPRLPAPSGVDGTSSTPAPPVEPTPAPTPSFTLEELDVKSDSTCRSQRCRCHWCKQALRRQLGVRPTLRSRAEDNGLDMDSPGWVCDLRGMGEISDDEWAELMGSSSDSQPEPEAATSAPPEPYCS